jgi:hypothetical protein
MRAQKHMSINQKMQLSLNVNRFRQIAKKIISQSFQLHPTSDGTNAEQNTEPVMLY